MSAKTLFEKIWDAHVVHQIQDGPEVLYIDRHFIHEVTSPQAFEGLRQRNLSVRCTHKTIATADHNVPTVNQHLPIPQEQSRKQVETLVQNCEEFGVELYGLGHPFQGIVHVIGPELGITQPGMTIVCGDSHTATHGAFGAIAFGIGTSQVEQVLATQSLFQKKPKTMRITIDGKLQAGVSAKDLILYVIAELGAGGAAGYFVEYAGSAIRSLSMEGRMTVCNMSIEMGARGGMVAPDETTFEYLYDREFAPEGLAFMEACERWRELYSDANAQFDQEVQIDAAQIAPMVTYGTSPDMAVRIGETIPINDQDAAPRLGKALSYMGLEGGQSMLGQKIDYAFIGSCTNSRIEDLRETARLVKGRQKAAHVTAWVIPGSKQVEKQAIAEGLDRIIREAGFEFRQPGCSACLAMNEDKIPANAYCISTSNRNFEGRQGPGARTILASPQMAAVAALTGTVEDVRNWLND